MFVAPWFDQGQDVCPTGQKGAGYSGADESGGPGDRNAIPSAD